MSHITKSIEEGEEEFEERFRSHPYGVFKDGKHIYPEFFTLTHDNVKSFLRAHTLAVLTGVVRDITQKYLVYANDDGTYSSDPSGNQLVEMITQDIRDAIATVK